MITQVLNQQIKDHWTQHTIIQGGEIETVAQSLDYLDWRNKSHIGYIESMPVNRADDLTILDYGCGPGHDLVGFAHFSKPKHLIGMDISATALRLSKRRLEVHEARAELVEIVQDQPLPLESNSIDLIHSSGVIHHASNPLEILSEFRRVLKPNGIAQIMVYHRDSVWMHLYVAYLYKILKDEFRDMTLQEIFKATTDGRECPVSNCYSIEEFKDITTNAGFICDFAGGSYAVEPELVYLPKRFEALVTRELNPVSRDFLYALRLDDRGLPIFQGRPAGINIAFRLKKHA